MSTIPELVRAGVRALLGVVEHGLVPTAIEAARAELEDIERRHMNGAETMDAHRAYDAEFLAKRAAGEAQPADYIDCELRRLRAEKAGRA